MTADVFRRKGPAGKPFGSYYAKIGGKLVNLGTRDKAAAKRAARERSKADEDTASVEAFTNSEEPAPAPAPAGPGADQTPPASTAPHTNGAAGASGWAADLNAAAGGAGPDASTVEVDLDEDLDLDELVVEAAKIAVELQVQAQALAWRMKKGIEVGEVPEGHLSRTRGEKLWRVFFRRVMPTTVKIPTWVMPFAAMGMTAGPTTMEQLKGARPAGSPPQEGQQPIDVEAT